MKKAIIILLMGVFLYSSYQIYDIVSSGIKSKEVFEELRPDITIDIDKQEKNDKNDENADSKLPTTKALLEHYQGLKEKNKDFVAWLKIPNSVVDYPIMHSTYDYEYYLHRDFNGDYSPNGTPFIDGNNSGINDDQLLIYGHNMKDGSMFSDIINYDNFDYYYDNKYLYLNTLDSINKYEIYSVVHMDLSKEHFPFYEYYNFNDEASFDNYVNTIKDLSLYHTEADVNYNDHLISLVTCIGNIEAERLIVFAKKIETISY